VLVLNLGCGTKVSPAAEVLNIDWTPFLRLRKSRILRPFAPILVGRNRRAAFKALGDNILSHDLSKGIPFPSGSLDAIYHSHLLEHIDREKVPIFMAEVRRVLKTNGIHRIVIPDFELVCRSYVAHIDLAERDADARLEHERYIGAILEQSVRRESAGKSKQSQARRLVENYLLGDARKRGETHQWMYDRLTICDVLQAAGFRDPSVLEYNVSNIPGWADFRLEVNADNSEYKPGSLYVEARK
jgi:hypothetical protein